MNDYEKELTNKLMQNLEEYIDDEDYQRVKNLVILALFDYDICIKSTEVAILDDFNERALKQFIATKRVEGRSQLTLERYEYFIRKFMNFYNGLSFTDVEITHLRYFLAYYQINGDNSNTTMDGIRRILSSFFNWLSDEDFIGKSPAKRLSKIKHDTLKEEPYTEAEMENMMIAAQTMKDKAILDFLYSSACRVNELVNIQISDIDFNRKRVLLHGKGNKDRIVPLGDKTMFYINIYLDSRKYVDSPWLFCSSRAPYGKLTPDAIRRRVSLIAFRAGVKNAHPHRYRVTRITTLLKRGMKIEEVQIIAGHSEISTTASYNRSDISLIESDFRRVG